jgi:uncharacterized oxidoreductase
MKMHSNTIFITGGTSGIGKGLAEAFHRLGNQVIVSGRREDRLRSICVANPGMRHFVLDVTDLKSIRNIARKVIEEFPGLTASLTIPECRVGTISRPKNRSTIQRCSQKFKPICSA